MVEGLTKHINNEVMLSYRATLNDKNPSVIENVELDRVTPLSGGRSSHVTQDMLNELHKLIIEDNTPIRRIVVMDRVGQSFELLNQIKGAGRTIVMPLHSYLQLRREAGEGDSVDDVFDSFNGARMPVNRIGDELRSIPLECIKYDEPVYFEKESKPKYTAGGRLKRRKF
jgi:hypothetical protein